MASDQNTSTVEWAADPVLLTLEASSLSRAGKGDQSPAELPLGFCLEVGRRLLLAELQFNEWTLRRVEKVILDRDRNLARDITVDFCIRPDAPTFVTSDGRRLRLVPLSMMRRRTPTRRSTVRSPCARRRPSSRGCVRTSSSRSLWTDSGPPSRCTS